MSLERNPAPIKTIHQYKAYIISLVGPLPESFDLEGEFARYQALTFQIKEKNKEKDTWRNLGKLLKDIESPSSLPKARQSYAKKLHVVKEVWVSLDKIDKLYPKNLLN